jgi:hypothetical protein
MEWFIPSLLVLLLAAIVCFIILPRLSPYILGVLSILMFCLGVWQNYTMFPYEYRLSLFTNLLQDYAPFVMVIAVILGAIVTAMVAFGVAPPAITEVIPKTIAEIIPAMPSIPMLNSKPNNNTAKNGNSGGLMGMINGSKPANNGAKNGNSGGLMAAFNGPKSNNSKRNNIASASFKTV